MEHTENNFKLSSLGYAYMGDAVYEVMTRAWYCARYTERPAALHKKVVARVAAPAQATACEKILPMLTEEEAGVFRRGRNAHVNSVPHGATVGQYHAATALEALFGWLYMTEQKERLTELFAVIAEDWENGN